MANATDSAHKWVRIGGDTMTGQLVIDNQTTYNSFNEGLRINNAPNGWAGVVLGGATGSIKDCPDKAWFIARRGSAGSSGGYGAIGDLTIEEQGSAGQGLTIHQNAGGMSLFTTKAASTASFTIKNTTAIAANQWGWGIVHLIPNIVNNGNVTGLIMGKATSAGNSGYINYHHTADNDNGNFVSIAHFGNDNLFKVFKDGRVQVTNHNGYAALNNTYGLRVGPDDNTHLDLGYDGLQGLNANSSAASAIYFQYAGGNIQHGKSGANSHLTSFGNINPGTTNAYTLGTGGSSPLRWSKLYVGTADSYGSSTQPIYWNAGVPTGVSWYPSYCTINGGNKANYPWHRFATCDLGTSTYTDKSVIVVIHGRYDGGSYGVIKLNARANASGAAIGISATWLVRYGFAAGDVRIAKTTNSTGTQTYVDAYIKCGTYPRRLAYILQGSNNGFSLINSNEVNNTTASDPLTSVEVYTDVTTAIGYRAYNAVVNSVDGGIVNLANKATAANLTTTANAVAYYTNTTGTFGTKASANGALYATSANGALTFGTLPTAQGGTGNTSYTANTIIYANTATKLASYTSTKGGTTKLWYLNAGVPTDSSATVGSATHPVYLDAGTITTGSYDLQGHVKYQTHNATTAGWSTMYGRQSIPVVSVTRHQATVPTWITQGYSSSILFGGSDTKGMINVGYNTPAVVFAGASTDGSTDDAPAWWMKITGTTGETYNFSTSGTFVRRAGDTMTGTLSFNDSDAKVQRVGRSKSWHKGRDGAVVRTTSISGYSATASIKTSNGSWDIGAYDSAAYTDDLLFSYVTDTLYNGSSATTTAQIKFLENSHIAAHGFDLINSGGDNQTYGSLNIDTAGTTSTGGISMLNLGNDIATGTAKNAKGMIRLYASTTYKTDISTAALTASQTLTLPNKSGTVALMSDIEWNSIGSQLADGEDLNNYNQTNSKLGLWYSGNSTKTGTLLHKPFTGSGFRMIALKGYGTTRGHQIIWGASATPYLRTENGTANTYGKWSKIVYIENVEDATAGTSTPTAVGSTTLPVYVTSDGKVTAISTNSVLTNLGSTTATSTYAASPRPGITGTLGTGHGGTGNTSYTANMLIYGESATKLASATKLYATTNKIGINVTSEPTYQFKVKGISEIGGIVLNKATISYTPEQIVSMREASYHPNWLPADSLNPPTGLLFFTSGGSGAGIGSVSATNDKFYLTGIKAEGDPNLYYNSHVYVEDNVMYGAAWNDYAEYRESFEIEPGRVVIELGNGRLIKSTDRLQPGAEVISDTYGFVVGEGNQFAHTPIAVAGRVLVYPYENKTDYGAGDAVCSGPNGTISKMTREEIREYPERIIGTVSEIPDYEYWGENHVKVNGRIWIRLR